MLYTTAYSCCNYFEGKITVKLYSISKTLVTFAACGFLSQAVVGAEWKYAMEEGLSDPQGLYATKFKEEIEKNKEVYEKIIDDAADKIENFIQKTNLNNQIQ